MKQSRAQGLPKESLPPTPTKQDIMINVVLLPVESFCTPIRDNKQESETQIYVELEQRRWKRCIKIKEMLVKLM